MTEKMFTGGGGGGGGGSYPETKRNEKWIFLSKVESGWLLFPKKKKKHVCYKNVVLCCVRILRPTNSWGHTETGPRFKVSSERLEKPGIELTTPDLQSW